MQDQMLLAIGIAVAAISLGVIALQIFGFGRKLGGPRKSDKKKSSSDDGFIL